MKRFRVEDKPSHGSYAIWDKEQDNFKVVEVFVWLPKAKELAHKICELLNESIGDQK